MKNGEAIRVAAYSGLRLGELLALRWRDVDWTGSALTISRSLSSGVEGTTKTGHVRRVPMADQAAAALDRLSKREDFTSPDDYVFCGPAGDPIEDSALRRRYNAARDAAGLPKLPFHHLRHTTASLLTMKGANQAAVQRILRHSDPRLTANIYSRVDLADLQAGIDRMGIPGSAASPS